MLAIAGCSEDNTHPKVSPVDEPSADAVTILATIDAIPSATGDGEAYAPLWQEGDQIIVGYKGMSYVYETYDAGNGVEFHPVALSLPADARGEVTAYFKAVDGVFAVGADQTGATLPMYAYAADAAPAQGSLGLHFKPLASVLSLTIGEEASKTISKITLEPVDPDGVEGHLAVSEAVVDPRTGAVTVGEDAAVSDILTMEIGEIPDRQRYEGGRRVEGDDLLYGRERLRQKPVRRAGSGLCGELRRSCDRAFLPAEDRHL